MVKETEEFTFKALGTHWSISLDDDVLRNDPKEAILEYVKIFEKRFSRFLLNSEVNAFRNAKVGKYPISKEFAVLLKKADQLRAFTERVYYPAAGGLLERAGYDAKYSMTPAADTEKFILPKWSIKNETLYLDGPAVFDLGGMGKGYCIDRVAGVLKSYDYKHFLVDGGGDMFGTTKADGSPWRIAVEYPGKPDTAAGMVYLKNQGLAVSDSFRRRWGKWHHLVNPKLKKSIESVVGAAAVAPSAWDADCMTSILFLSEGGAYSKAAEEYGASYMVFNNGGTCLVSPNWEGELF